MLTETDGERRTERMNERWALLVVIKGNGRHIGFSFPVYILTYV